MKKIQKTKGGRTVQNPGRENAGHSEIKPDYPLSEKDEVKLAEEKMRKVVKNGR
jgi:hypothetical protein